MNDPSEELTEHVAEVFCALQTAIEGEVGQPSSVIIEATISYTGDDGLRRHMLFETGSHELPDDPLMN